MTFGLTEFDHEIVIDGTTRRLSLIREQGKAVYEVTPERPNYRDPLRIIQSNWVDGHGQYNVSIDDMYFEGESIDTTQEGRVILGPLINVVTKTGPSELDSPVLGFFWYEDEGVWLCWTTSYVYIYDVGSNGLWTVAKTDLAGVTGMAEYNGIVYAAMGTDNLYYTSDDGDTWYITDLYDGYAEKFLTAPDPDGTSNMLWKFKKPNEISWTDNGVAGGTDWEQPTFVGDRSSNIVDIFLFNNKLMVGREDNLYHVDGAGGVHAWRDDLKKNQSINNFKYIAYWQTALYHSEGRQMAEITKGNTYVPMGPLTAINLQKALDDIGKVGDIVGITADKDYLYVAMDEGDDIIIYKGREIRKKSILRWQWSPWIFVGENACTTIAICQHSSTDIRLWYAYGNNTAYAIITDNPTSDDAARFAPEGFLRMSYDIGTNPEWDMLLQSVVTETKGCNSSGEDVVVKYRKDTAGAVSCTGDITTNGTVETNFTAAINCNRIQFEIHLSSNTNTATPEVLYFEAKGIEKPEVIRRHRCVYKIASDQEDNAETLRAYLRGGAESTGLIKFADMRYGDSTSGTSYVWVVMEPDSPREVEIWHEKEAYPEMGIECVFREVSYTIS